MPEDTDQVDMPRHVREAEARAREFEEAAAKQAASQNQTAANAPASPDASTPTGKQQPSEQPGAPAAQADPADATPAATPAEQPAETVESLKAMLADANALLTDFRNRQRRRWGQTQAERENKDREMQNLKDHIARLEAQQAGAAGRVDDDKAVLLRNGVTEADMEDMSEREIHMEARRWKAVEATKNDLAAERERLRASMETNTKATRLKGVDAEVESLRPGFLAATQPGSDYEAEWDDFGSLENPDSATGATWKKSLAAARETGNKAEIIRIADLFAKDAGIAFGAQTAGGASRVAGADRVAVPPQRVMPSSGPALPSFTPAPPPDATPKRTYPRAYVEKFLSQSPIRQGSTFRPFTVSAGGITKTFSTDQEREQEYQALLLAGEEGRIART